MRLPAWLAGRRYFRRIDGVPAALMPTSKGRGVVVAFASNISFAPCFRASQQGAGRRVRRRERDPAFVLAELIPARLRKPHFSVGMRDCQLGSLAFYRLHNDQKQELDSVFDGREWSLNVVSDFASCLVCLCCGCQCRLGKTLTHRNIRTSAAHRVHGVHGKSRSFAPHPPTPAVL
jgi:hypothetical protein